MGPVEIRRTRGWKIVFLEIAFLLGLKDINGVERRPFEVAKRREAVLFFITNDCPISNAFAPEIARVCSEYKSVDCTLVYVDPALSDDAARDHIRAQGFGEYFFHRTGHSIGTEVHGSGANMDNLETHDERRIIPWTCFSVEPGIYLSEFGVRSEVNVFVGDDGARVTGEVQEKLVSI